MSPSQGGDSHGGLADGVSDLDSRSQSERSRGEEAASVRVGNLVPVSHVPSVQEHRYEKLQCDDSIRLLRPEPADTDDEALTGCLTHVRLSEPLQSEAISYAWGEAIFSANLDLTSGRTYITNSLAAALRAFRQTSTPRYLWADALCINQQDINEKNVQVAKMGEIYSGASSVLVWLGPGDQRTGHVVDLSRQLCSIARHYAVQDVPTTSMDLRGDIWDGLANISNQQLAKRDSIALEFDFRGMDEFYSQPWFQRLWVIQEVALARRITIRCGSHEIAWETLVTAARVQSQSVRRGTLHNLRLPYGFAFFMVIETMRMVFLKWDKYRLLTNLDLCRGSLCSNDLDYVYALLSMSGPGDPKIVPDYRISVRELFIKVGQAFLQILADDGYELRTLYYAAQNSGDHHRPEITDPSDQLPSWVPDWRSGVSMPNRRSFASGSNNHFAAGLRFKPVVSFASDEPILNAQVIFIDMILDGQSTEGPKRLSHEQLRQELLRWKSFYDRNYINVKPEAPAPIDQLTRFVRTITADLSDPSAQDFLRGQKSGRELVELWLKYAAETTPATAKFHEFAESGQGSETTTGGTVYRQSDLHAFGLALRSTIENRQFIVTYKERVGLAPGIVQPGDMLALMPATVVPFVLRKTGQTSRGQPTWYLIGDCYLDGVMYGELWKEKMELGHSRTEVSVQEIKIA